MLRIQDSLTFKDPMGRVYKTNEMILSLRDNAKIYSVADSNQYLFVRFVGDNHPSESVIRTMCDCASNEMAKANVLWPERICYRLDDDMFCGFLARAIDISSDLITLNQLILPDVLSETEITKKLTVGLNIAKCIHAVHRTSKRYVIGVPRPRDFHVAPDGRVLFCYAYRCDMDIRDQYNSIYAAPEYRSMQGNLSSKSDAFSYAMILFSLLTGVLPFGSHEPQTIFEETQIADMILNGESIYYYENAPQAVAIDQMLSEISPELAMLFRLTFDYCGLSQYDAARPSIVDWINTLEKRLQKDE